MCEVTCKSVNPADALYALMAEKAVVETIEKKQVINL
jgi:hypothetical protein